MFQRTGSAVIPGLGLADPIESFAGDPMKELDQWLSDANVAPVHRTTLVEGVRSRMVSARPTRDLVERSFIEEIAGRVQPRPQSELDNRRLVAFVGPTGVGKTTTVAKLAAEYTRKQRRSVGLLTLDTHRVGSVDQIARYAELLEIPLEVVSDRADLERALRRLENCDKVLVDTIGRSPRDARPARQVREIFVGVPGISYELCLSATTSLQDMRGILESYAEIVPENLLFTKLDEAFALGPLVGAHLEETLPLSYFTTGQQVPEDIERASIERIIGMMIPFE